MLLSDETYSYSYQNNSKDSRKVISVASNWSILFQQCLSTIPYLLQYFYWLDKYRIKAFLLTQPLINPFVSNTAFLYHLATSENLTAFLCFQGAE